MNQVCLIGRWAQDPELKYTPNGTSVVNAIIAVNRPLAKEGQQDVDFLPIVIWGKYAEAVANHTKKGSLISIVGRLQSRNYDDQEGKKHRVIEVVSESVQFLS